MLEQEAPFGARMTNKMARLTRGTSR